MATASQKATIRDLAEQLDAHRKERIDTHDTLTMTALYNVLKKERRSEDLDESEREIHEKGLVGVLKELHDELDAAVADAYGWDAGLSEEEILQNLVDLNAERRAEEEEGHVRYLRPAYQAPETVETQAELDLALDIGDDVPAEPLDWPSGLKARAQAVRAVTTHADESLTVEQVAQHFQRARRSDVQALLGTFAALGHVEGAPETLSGTKRFPASCLEALSSWRDDLVSRILTPARRRRGRSRPRTCLPRREDAAAQHRVGRRTRVCLSARWAAAGVPLC